MQFDQPLGGMGMFDSIDASSIGLADCALPDYRADSSLMELFQPNWSLAAPTTRELHIEQVIAKRLQFAIDEIKRAPALMIMETQTPWCHPLLYRDGMPKSMKGPSPTFIKRPLDSYTHCPP
jgi:hypothetical protein